jgi:hypothetical protein
VRSDDDIIISTIPRARGGCGFVVYDVDTGIIVNEITDYAQALVRSGLSSITIEQGLNHLLEMWRYLGGKSSRLASICDGQIENFRDDNLKKVKRSRAYRGSEEQAKVTVNAKLCRIYHWLLWLQEKGYLRVGTIGQKGLVVAISETTQSAARAGARKVKWKFRPARNYPLLFKTKGNNGKHGAYRPVIQDEHVTSMYAAFIEKHQPFVAQRNILFAEIADSAGFRRGSICSLRVDQFTADEIHSAEEVFLVRPTSQKFGYTKTFEISLVLAYRIREFIDQYWLPWTIAKEVSESAHLNRLFLSSRTGKPITDGAMTSIVSRAFKQQGFGKGTGVHKLRGKFTSRETDDELAERRELGLDTSNRSIAAAISMKLGHDDPDQFYGYASSSQARQAQIARDGRLAELKRLREENEQFRQELAHFRRDPQI